MFAAFEEGDSRFVVKGERGTSGLEQLVLRAAIPEFTGVEEGAVPRPEDGGGVKIVGVVDSL